MCLPTSPSQAWKTERQPPTRRLSPNPPTHRSPSTPTHLYPPLPSSAHRPTDPPSDPPTHPSIHRPTHPPTDSTDPPTPPTLRVSVMTRQSVSPDQKAERAQRGRPLAVGAATGGGAPLGHQRARDIPSAACGTGGRAGEDRKEGEGYKVSLQAPWVGWEVMKWFMGGGGGRCSDVWTAGESRRCRESCARTHRASV